MTDWILDHLGWLTLGVIAVVVVLVVLSVRSMHDECNDMMKLARTPHDSLEVHIACNRMQSDFARNMAIGAAAGAAGAAAASRR